MKTLRQILLVLLTTCCALVARADELTVTNLRSSASEGVVISFSQDVKVKHSVFGKKCYSAFNDADGTPSSLNATPRTEGNVVTLAAAYCTFVNGHRIHLVLNADCFTTLDGTTSLTGETTFDFVMGEGEAAEPITALQIVPASGTMTTLRNVAIVFSPAITDVLSPGAFTLTNEHGHSVPIYSVTIDGETEIKALNVNPDPEFDAYESGTTYSLHIAPGGIKCGGLVNEKEMVFGKWEIYRHDPLVVVTNPPHRRIVENLSRVTITAENGEAMTCSLIDDPSKLTITGIMDEQNIVFATATSIRSNALGTAFIASFDRAITPEVLSQAGTKHNSVKMVLPKGAFAQGTKVNDETQLIWTIEEPVEMGYVSWHFTPASATSPEGEGRSLTALGQAERVENPTGGMTTIYLVRFGITGENAYLATPHAADIRLINAHTGMPVMTFREGDVQAEGINSFSLRLSHQITDDGTYTLIIPAASVNLHTDLDHNSQPLHPDDDVTATWIIGDASTTGAMLPEVDGQAQSWQRSGAIYDLQGRPLAQPQRGQTVVKHGKKVIATPWAK